ncbi:MAG: glycosyltransferase [Gemmatimonas sp.]|nr:glycosyltransferase [Gemmatimonas sp.]
MKAEPTVFGVVLNWCNGGLTATCLRSLEASDCPNLQILLVDNASPDGSGAELHASFPHLSYLQTGANLGYTGGNNRGIEWCLDTGADYVLILNNDTEIATDAVSRLVEVATREARVGAVAPKILYHAAPERTWYAGGDMSRLRVLGHHRGEGRPDNSTRDEPQDVSFLTGCCLLLSGEALRDVGLLAEDLFTYAEDVELSLRLQKAGYRLVYQPAARVLHHVPFGRSEPNPAQIYHRDRNRRRVARRHLTAIERIGFQLFFYPTRFIHLMRYLLMRDGERLRAVWRGMTAP